MMTALSQAEDKARAAQLGADRYLVKSQVTLEDVARVAKEVLDGTPATPSSGGLTPTPITTPVTNPEPPEPVNPPTPVAPTPVVEPPTTAAPMPATQPSTPAIIAETIQQEEAEIESQIADFAPGLLQLPSRKSDQLPAGPRYDSPVELDPDQEPRDSGGHLAWQLYVVRCDGRNCAGHSYTIAGASCRQMQPRARPRPHGRIVARATSGPALIHHGCAAGSFLSKIKHLQRLSTPKRF